jgi:uncharacterized membrane protein YhhN
LSIITVLGLAVVLLLGLLKAEKTGIPTRILIFKTPLSLLFIVAWGLQSHPNVLFSGLVLVALACCCGGDILLALGSRRAFLLGLCCFLFAHVMYAAAFFMKGTLGPGMAMGVILMVAAAGFIWRWLEPHLGTMTIPALAYLVIISTMVCGAWAIVGNPHIPDLTRSGVFAGAALFYLSDIAVARQRFVQNDPMNRVVGLPLYYMAQFMLAFSSAWIPA